MPIIQESTYQTSMLFKNPHFNTAYRSLFKAISIPYKRKRIKTWDDDFLDVDFSMVGSKEIVVIVHGLEGSSQSRYVLALVSLLNDNNYDTASINLRGCSGENNKLLGSYHSGKTDDIDYIIKFTKKNYNYKKLHLAGYSLGGNVVLKYMGEYANSMPSIVKSAYSISPPCDLKGSSIELSRISRLPYMKMFLKSLKQKTLHRLYDFPDSFLNKKSILAARNFYDFDNLYTAPAHGFKDAEDYWKKSSSNRYLSKIKRPTLIITSVDDPFLSNSCVPYNYAKRNKNLFLDAPRYGGHVGFVEKLNGKKIMWSEKRILEFLRAQ